MMISINKRFNVPVCIAMILGCIIVLAFLSEVNGICIPAASAENNVDITDSLTHNGIVLTQYTNSFNAETQQKIDFVSSLGNGYCFNNSFANNVLIYNDRSGPSITVNGDDNIVNFVPKSCFTHATTKLHIGKKYGYAIQTKEYSGYNLSTVILMLNESEWINDTYKVKLTTLAKIDYIYLYNTHTGINLNNLQGNETYNVCLYYNPSSGAYVVPVIRYIEHLQNDIIRVGFRTSCSLSLSNMSIASLIYNQNALNTWDTGYDANEDEGYFLIGNNYSYQITKHSTGSTPPSMSAILSDIGELALGTLLSISGLDTLGHLYNIASAMVSLANSVDNVGDVVLTNVGETSCQMGMSSPNWTTRADQIANYGKLIKTSSLGYNTNDYSLWLETDDFIEARFTYSHTNAVYNYSRLNISIGAVLVEKTDSNSYTPHPVVNEADIYTEKNSPTTTSIGLWEESAYYMSPYATQQFSFTATPYNTRYILSINGDVGTVTINGNTVDAVNGQYVFDGTANTTYTIVLDNDGDFCCGALSIALDDSGNDIPAGQTRLVKYTLPFDGLIQWNTGNVNVSMLEIFTYNNGFSVYKVGGVVSFSETVGGALPMPTGTYYILVSNSASISVSITLSATLCSFTNSNIISNLAVQGQYYFISLSPSYVDGYMLTVDSNDALVFSTYIILYGIGGNVGLITGNHATCQPSPQMQPLYVGVSVGSVGPAIVNLRIEHVEDSLQWTVDGEIVSSIVSLGRNDSYQIGVVLNGIYSDLYAIIMDNIITGLLIDGTTLRISDSIPLDSTVYEITAKPSAMTSFDPKFRFRLKEDDKLLLSSYNNGSGCGFNIQLNKTGISWLTYNFYNENNSVISNGTVVTTEGINQYTIAVTTGGTSRFVRLGINQTSRNGDNRTFLGSVSVDSWFGGGTGTASDPNLITYPWQFNNIYRATSQCFKQTSNLNFSNIGTRRGVSFYGTYNAFSHSITGINMSITYSNEAFIGGMFDRNYGTITGLTQFSATISVVSATNATVDVGGIVGYNVNGASITGLCAFCTVSSDSKVSSSHIGGLVGYNCGTMWVPLQDNITVQGYCNIGGVAGRNVGTINTAMMACEIHYSRVSSAANCSVGGIAGKNTGTINVDFLYSDIDILIDNISGNKTNRPRVGLLVGENYSGTVTVAGDTPFGSIDADDLIPVCQTYINFNGNIGYNH